MTLTTEGAIVSVNLNGSGMLTVTAQADGTKGCVHVYTADGTALAEVNAHRRFVSDACVTEDGKALAVVLMGQESGTFVSSVVFYDLTTPGAAEVTAEYTVPDGLVTAMACRNGRILTVTDTCFASGSANGTLAGSYAYESTYLREYDLGGGDFTALLLNRYQAGSVGRLVTVDDEGAEIGRAGYFRGGAEHLRRRAVSLRAVRKPSGGLHPGTGGLRHAPRPGARPAQQHCP